MRTGMPVCIGGRVHARTLAVSGSNREEAWHMQTFLTEVRETLAPARTTASDRCRRCSSAMTVVTGLVDAFSYLLLGHVFVANMTGNVVFLGFAVAGAPGFSIAASLVALASFGVGSVVGGRIVQRFGHHRGHHVAVATATQAVLLSSSVVLAFVGAQPFGSGVRYALIVVLAPGDGRAELERPPLGRARPDDDGADTDGHGDRRRQCARWREGLQVGSAPGLGASPCSWARWPARRSSSTCTSRSRSSSRWPSWSPLRW